MGESIAENQDGPCIIVAQCSINIKLYIVAHRIEVKSYLLKIMTLVNSFL